MAAVTRRGRRTGPTLIKKKSCVPQGESNPDLRICTRLPYQWAIQNSKLTITTFTCAKCLSMLGSVATFKASNAITEIFSRAQTMQSIVLWVVSVKVLVWWRTWEGIVQVTLNYAILGSNSSLPLSNAKVAHLIRSLLTQCREISKSYLSLIFRIIQPFIVAEF